jgi:hypothetical protein
LARSTTLTSPSAIRVHVAQPNDHTDPIWPTHKKLLRETYWIFLSLYTKENLSSIYFSVFVSYICMYALYNLEKCEYVCIVGGINIPAYTLTHIYLFNGNSGHFSARWSLN